MYINTALNTTADQASRAVPVSTGDEAYARAAECLGWAADALPGYDIADWTDEAFALLRSSPFGVRPSSAPAPTPRRKCGALPRRSGRNRHAPSRLELSFGPDGRQPGEFAKARRPSPSAPAPLPDAPASPAVSSRAPRATPLATPGASPAPARAASPPPPPPPPPSPPPGRAAIPARPPSPPWTLADATPQGLRDRGLRLCRLDAPLAFPSVLMYDPPSAVVSPRRSPRPPPRAALAPPLPTPSPAPAFHCASRRPNLPSAPPARGAAKETWHPDYVAKVRALGFQLVTDALAPETRAKHEAHWGHFALFCHRRGADEDGVCGPWLPGRHLAAEERLILEFIAYEGTLTNDGRGWTVGTVRHKLAAVKFFHLHHYLPDPTSSPRISGALRALQRQRREPTSLRMPVTKDILLALLRQSHARAGPAAVRSPRDNAAYRAAAVCAWLYLLRSAEYADATNGRGDPRDYCLRLGDLALYDESGAQCSLHEPLSAARLSLALRGSKTDQARLGCVRSLQRTPGELDAVALVAGLLRFLSPVELSSPSTPLFSLDSGRPVSSSGVTGDLRAAAKSSGLDPARYATHSLRRGGATALVAAGVNPETVRRFGRWLSDAWRTYVFGTTEHLGDLAAGMVNADYTIAMALEDFRASVPRAAE